jgi:hypothetical protein
VKGKALPVILRGKFRFKNFRSACENAKMMRLVGLTCLYETERRITPICLGTLHQSQYFREEKKERKEMSDKCFLYEMEQ